VITFDKQNYILHIVTCSCGHCVLIVLLHVFEGIEYPPKLTPWEHSGYNDIQLSRHVFTRLQLSPTGLLGHSDNINYTIFVKIGNDGDHTVSDVTLLSLSSCFMIWNKVPDAIIVPAQTNTRFIVPAQTNTHFIVPAQTNTRFIVLAQTNTRFIVPAQTNTRFIVPVQTNTIVLYAQTNTIFSYAQTKRSDEQYCFIVPAKTNIIIS
jgi:hypothetical protein